MGTVRAWLVASFSWLACVPAWAEEPAVDPLATQAAALEAQVAEHVKAKDEAALVTDAEAVLEFFHKVKEGNAELGERAIDLLGDVLKAAKEEGTEVAVLQALGKTDDPRAAKHVKPYLRQRDRESAEAPLQAAVRAAAWVVDDSLVEPLLKLVEDSKHYPVAAMAIESLAAYGRCERKRAKILEAITKTVERSKPGGPPGMRGGSKLDPMGGGDEGSTTGQESGSTSRWAALVAVYTESMNRLTGQSLRSPDDWFHLVKDRKGKLDQLFKQEEKK